MACATEGDLASFRSYIDRLPVDDAPETFGLHENADTTLQQKETRFAYFPVSLLSSSCVCGVVCCVALCAFTLVVQVSHVLTCNTGLLLQRFDDDSCVDATPCGRERGRPQP